METVQFTTDELKAILVALDLAETDGDYHVKALRDVHLPAAADGLASHIARMKQIISKIEKVVPDFDTWTPR